MNSGDLEHSRREFMAGSAGVISGSTLAEFIQIKNTVLEFIGLNKHEDNLEISLFQTDKMAEINKENRDNKEYSLNLSEKYLEQELSKLSDKETFEVDVHLSSNYIPRDDITHADKEDTMESWREYYRNKIDDSEKSRDSNILLTHVDGFANTRGFGEYPCSCRNRSTVGIIYNANLIQIVDEDKIIGKTKSLNHFERSLSTLLHEVGHNLGFTHDMGYAWHDEEENRIKVTPMMSDYYRNTYSGEKNQYGDRVVDIDELDTAIIDYKSDLNPKIDHSDIHYERT